MAVRHHPSRPSRLLRPKWAMPLVTSHGLAHGQIAGGLTRKNRTKCPTTPRPSRAHSTRPQVWCSRALWRTCAQGALLSWPGRLSDQKQKTPNATSAGHFTLSGPRRSIKPVCIGSEVRDHMRVDESCFPNGLICPTVTLDGKLRHSQTNASLSKHKISQGGSNNR